MKLLYVMKYGFLSHLRTLYLSDNRLHDSSVQGLIELLRQRRIVPSAEIYIGCRSGEGLLRAGNNLSNSVVQELVSLLYSSSVKDPILKYVILEKSESETRPSHVEKKKVPKRLLQRAILPRYCLENSLEDCIWRVCSGNRQRTLDAR